MGGRRRELLVDGNNVSKSLEVGGDSHTVGAFGKYGDVQWSDVEGGPRSPPPQFHSPLIS